MTEEHPMRDPDQYRYTWTKHPDAYPDLTHCPSCGEETGMVQWADPFAGKPKYPVRCEQCGRDLRLPKDAVKDQLCLVCKVPATDAGEDVRYHRLETGERMCSNCTEDLRAFKYEMETVTFVAEWISDEHRDALNAALFEVADDFEKEYAFTADANARYGRLEPDPQDLTLEQLIDGDIDPEELPDEARAKLAEMGGADE